MKSARQVSSTCAYAVLLRTRLISTIERGAKSCLDNQKLIKSISPVPSSATSMFSSLSAFQISLLVSSFLVTVVFGFVLLFSIVIMPGISTLKDDEYLHAFQVIDKVIQDTQPVFTLFWIATIPAVITSLVLGIRGGCDTSVQLGCLIAATAAVLVGQGVTVVVNIPRNNRLQALDFDSLDDFSAKRERDHFESAWCRANTFRTWLFFFASIVLMVLPLVLE